MQIGFFTLLSIIVTSSIFMTGCYRGPSAEAVYGRASNADRKARGIPIIPATWIERSGGGPQADWNNPEHADARTTHNPMHTYKELFLDKSGNLWREDDFYQSGKQCHPVGSDPGELQPEELTTTYNFEAARAGKNPWHCEVNGGPHYTPPDGEVTLKEAEAILKEWGLKRLNY